MTQVSEGATRHRLLPRLLRKPPRHVLWAGALLVVVGIGALGYGTQPVAHHVSVVLEYDPRTLASLAGGALHPQIAHELIETQMLVMTSIAACREAMEALSGNPHGFGGIVRDRDPTAISAQCSRLKVRRLGTSFAVELRYHDEDKDRAVLMADAVAQAYIARSLSQRAGGSRPVQHLLEELEMRDSAVLRHREALASFARDHELTSIESESAIAAGAVRSYTEALTNANIRKVRSSARLAQLELAGAQHDLQSPFFEGAQITALRGRAQQLETEQRMLSVSTDSHSPRLGAVRAELEHLQVQLEREVKRLVDSARGELSIIEREEKDLQRALEQAIKVIRRLADLKVEFTRLEHAATREEAIRSIVLGRIERNGTSSAKDGWFVRVLTPAQPIRPWSSL